MSLDLILIAKTGVELQAIGLKERIDVLSAKPKGYWPEVDIEQKRHALAKLRTAWRIFKWFAEHPEHIPAQLAEDIGVGG